MIREGITRSPKFDNVEVFSSFPIFYKRCVVSGVEFCLEGGWRFLSGPYHGGGGQWKYICKRAVSILTNHQVKQLVYCIKNNSIDADIDVSVKRFISNSNILHKRPSMPPPPPHPIHTNYRSSRMRQGRELAKENTPT